MIPRNRIATHPGIVLVKEFLEPLGQTQRALADHIRVPGQRVNEIARGKQGISPATAWLFSQAFGTTPEFWLNLQNNHDLSVNRPEKQIPRFAQNSTAQVNAESSSN